MNLEAPLETLSDEQLETLDKTLDGDLILPHYNEYEDARDVWNGLIDKHPAIIVRVQHADDVAVGIQFATEHGLELSIRGNAHHQTGSALVENGLVIDLADLTDIDVDVDNNRVTVGAGATAGQALEQTLEYGLAFPTGSASVVGISGSTLSGGLGWMRRKNGAGIDALREVEIVTADGEVRTISPNENEQLFYAVCGAGANFGVVTSLSFDLFETPPVVPALSVFYDPKDAEQVLESYRELTQDAPEEFTSFLLNTHVPPMPDVPEELHGRPSIAILGAYIGEPDEAEDVLAEYQSLGEPLINMSGDLPYIALHELGADMFPDGHLYSQRSMFVDEVTDEHLDLVRTGTDDSPSPISGIGIWDMGGAIGDSDHETSVPWDDKQYMITVEGQWLDDETTDANLEWVRGLEQDAREIGGEYAYGGFVGFEEQDYEDWSDLVYGGHYDRLADLKAEYDPENVFSTNINIEPNI